MSIIHNNVAISDVEYTKISKNSIGPQKSSLYRAYTDEQVALPVVLADNAHDHLSHLNLKSGSLENVMLLSTKISSGPTYPLLKDIISSVGKCFEYIIPSPSVQQEFPQYDIGVHTPFEIPDNKLYCLIRDCFPGTWVPGLNNIFDQAGASLKTFIEYHNNRNGWTLRNPVKKTVNNDNAGGLGQQLKVIGHDHLKYTAYFNYDLLWFKYITSMQDPILPGIRTELYDLKDKVIRAIAQDIGPVDPADLLTPDEIIMINTVNINFLWCKLMIYCFDCVVDDEYFINAHVNERTGYLDALQKLTQIRFDSFAYTQDGYISNPFIYYRSTSPNQPSNIFTEPASVVYINDMCTRDYNNLSRRHPGANIFGVNENLILAGGVEYVTSQAMAASCMRQFIALFKSSGRSKNTGDFTKISSMNEINTLFNKMVGRQVKVNKGYGWAILKFSGDSSHIVFGGIMEDIKTAAAAEGDTDLGRIKIIYAISERPLLARLLAAQKNVYFLLNNASVLKEYYTGPGSEFKTEPHAVLYIQWDPSITFNNIVDGFVGKVNDLDAPQPPGGPGPIENTGTSIDKLIQLYDLFDITLPSHAAAAQAQAAAPLTEADYNNLIDEFKAVFLITTDVIAFLKQYRKKQVEKKMLAIMTSNPNYSPISSKLGAQGRAAGNTNWFWLMDTINAPDSAFIAGGTKGIHDFDEICLIFNLLVEYYIELGGEVDTYYNNFFRLPGFYDIFKKIITSHRTTLLKRKDTEKIETFIQTREQDWISSQKKNSERIPNKVGAAINQMETLMLNCWKLHEYQLPRGTRVTQFGGNDNDNDYVKKQVGGAVTADGLNIRMDIEETLIHVLTHSQIEDLLHVNNTKIIDIPGLLVLDKLLNDTSTLPPTFDLNTRIFQINERVKIMSAVDYIRDFAISYPEDATADATDATGLVDMNRFNKLLIMNPSIILAKRLKLLDISDDTIIADVNAEKTYLNKALFFLGTYIQSLAAAPGASAAPPSQILTNLTTLHIDIDNSTVLSELSSLTDIKEDSGIVLNKGSGIIPTAGNPRNIHQGVLDIYNTAGNKITYKRGLIQHFPHLNEDEYKPFLGLVQELAKSDPIINLKRGANNNVQTIYLLKRRVEVSKILSKSRLMEIIFDNLADTDRTNRLIQSHRTRIEKFFRAVSMIAGGKKTIKKRRKTNHRKTKRNKPNPKNKTKNNRKRQIKAKKKQKRRTIKKNHKK